MEDENGARCLEGEVNIQTLISWKRSPNNIMKTQKCIDIIMSMEKHVVTYQF